MGNPTVAIVTKTYAPDLHRCEFLCRSIDSLVTASSHWIVVDRRDRRAFAHLEGQKRYVVTTEEVLPIRARRITFGRLSRRRNLWLSTHTRPMRGWLVQQLAKLAIGAIATEDVLFFVDSDIVFIREFDAIEHTRVAVPLYCVPAAIDEQLPTHVRWHRTAEQLLGLPPAQLPAPDFVGPLIFWRRANAIELLDHVETRTRTDWIAALGKASDVSEYTLYGRFATGVLGDASGHSLTPRGLCHSYWGTEPLTEAGLDGFLGGLLDDHVSVMLNPKAGMDAGWYTPLLERHQTHLAHRGTAERQSRVPGDAA